MVTIFIPLNHRTLGKRVVSTGCVTGHGCVCTGCLGPSSQTAHWKTNLHLKKFISQLTPYFKAEFAFFSMAAAPQRAHIILAVDIRCHGKGVLRIVFQLTNGDIVISAWSVFACLFSTLHGTYRNDFSRFIVLVVETVLATPWKKYFVLVKNASDKSIGVARGPCLPKFLEYLVILCFLRRYPKNILLLA